VLDVVAAVPLRQIPVVLRLAAVGRCCGVLADRIVEQRCGFVRGRRAATRATEVLMRPSKPLLGKEPSFLRLRHEHEVRCKGCRFDDPDARTPCRLARRRSPRTSRGGAVAKVVRASVGSGDTGVCTTPRASNVRSLHPEGGDRIIPCADAARRPAS
jgi:hypothetical protein